ncbi:hypothetical protein BCR42DRAFT_424626 [Absidia repens]|uniref:DUF4149 domain-containing protein n=1 Tax=Absidia repens TaxID=90262 RepID=A0A1X2I560_9FUNG|nr:hypothetical protein BCR42DRAFT_424626 [Absidia repens]
MSCCNFEVAKFLRDPYSTVKILLPTAAIQTVMHCKVWSDKSTRHLAIALLATTVGRFALNVHLGWIETPILNRLPCLTDDQKIMLNDYRMSLISKMDLLSGLAVMDIFYIYSQRPMVNVPPCVTTVMVAPVAISVLQGICLMPQSHRQVARVHEGKSTSADLLNDASFVQRRKIFVGLDFVKVSCLAIAGLRFGCQLSK